MTIKTKNKINLQVIGGNCEAVTGSCTEITFNGRTMLFEFGLIQEGKTIKEDYALNKQFLTKVKPSAIDTIFIGHVHADHSCNIPALYHGRKCKAKIIVPKGSTKILKRMWLDSAFINERNCAYLSLKEKKKYEPLYNKDDVDVALSYVEEFPSHQIIKLDEEVSFRYIPAGHILLSQQTELFISGGSHTKKIVFTSDLGNTLIENNKVFTEKFEPISKSNIVIGECTYASKKRAMTKKTLEKDIEKIDTVIRQFCIEGKRRVLIPTFSLDRMPYILWILYELYGKDKNFNIPILVDSPLAIGLLQDYSEILEGEMKEKFDAMMSWSNIKLIQSPEDSRAAMVDNRPKIICSSSGMMTAGRSVKWARSLLPKQNDCILFIGYCATNTLAYNIKNGADKKKISIGGVEVDNKCKIVDLHSFSSHMQREQLINYYKSFNCDKIYLVHGNREDKNEFKRDLEDAIKDCLKTTRVVSVNRSTKITL